VLLVLVMAGPAAADPAVPTNYSSTVRGIDPASDAVRAKVVGGDSFLQITVDRGHTVTVLGYDGEPYLRIDTDGTVAENTRSPAVVLNEARYGRVATDDTSDATAAPVWRTVGHGGTYAWHDHRIHWMSSVADPPQLAGASAGKVFDWTVPVLVDGAAATVRGDLVLLEAPSIVPTVVIGVVALAAFGIVMRRWRRATGVVLAGAALAATVAGWLDQHAVPSAVGRQFSLWSMPAVAFVCAVVAVARPGARFAMVLRLAAAAILPLWFLRELGALNHAVLPGDLEPSLLRATVVVAMAAVVAYLAIDLPRETSRGATASNDPAASSAPDAAAGSDAPTED
jgi:hypothetical protein